MLLKLPSEIILKISRYLNYGDKYQLMTTCSVLKDLILHRSLYEELTIDSKNSYIFRQFENMEINGNQVKNLQFDMEELSNHQIALLPTIFPNVVKMYNSAMTDMKIQNDHTLTTWLEWKDRLTCYESENGDCYRISYLIEKNTFSCLTNLKLTNFYEGNDGSEKLDVNIIDCISHVPSLKKLDLENCEVNIFFFEKLHTSCPHMVELRLDYVLVNTRGERLPQPVVPAANFKYLYLCDGVVICDPHCIFLDYIKAKYPNLDDLYFESSEDEAYLEMYQEKMYLSDPDAQISTVSEKIITQRLDFDATCTGYLNAGKRFLSQLPRSLETLQLKVTLFTDIIEALTQSQINPKMLHFRGDIFHFANVFDSPDKLGFLKRLTSLKNLEVALNTNLQEYAEDCVSSSLKELTTTVVVNPLNETMDFAWILSAFPSLETLKIFKPVAILIGSQQDSQRNYPSLEFLLLDSCVVHESAWSCLGNMAPNLREIVFIVYLENNGTAISLYSSVLAYEQKHYTFDLTGYKLDSFRLLIHSLDDQDKRHDINFEILIQNAIIKTELTVSGTHHTQYRLAADEIQDPSSIIPKFTFILDRRIKIKVGNLTLLDR